ncbi:hypothetical protein [Bordetella flabilis]|uniref:Uncharacterized protein n=1 Tax=Bordetella flabilis TaxID=463014 RepID=A0A193GLT3_9BORD|nr:hypothetical protein [Bordetella flabilis]ANN80830.1 hypothetical protein BAU07_26245 [Bordetella flabilis]
MMPVVEPSLQGDFGLISVAERVQWREALPRHLLGAMKQRDGSALPAWKVAEHIQPTLITIHELFNTAPLATLHTLEEYFSPASLAHRSDYAS